MDEVDHLNRGRLDVPCTFDVDGRCTEPFSRNKGVQQGQGSSPSSLVTLVEISIWMEWHETAKDKQLWPGHWRGMLHPCLLG